MFQKLKEFLAKHKRHLPAAALLAGLVWDSLTLGRPDRIFDNIVLLFYLFLAGACIVVMSLREHRGKERSLWFVVITQFAFGNLASGLLILYTASATLIGNWVFLFLLAGFLVGNEVFQSRYDRLRFNTTVYYLLLLAYLVLLIPVLLRAIGAWVFLASGFVSLVVIGLFLLLLRTTARGVFEANQKQLLFGVAGVFLLFNVFYFFNVIPPVPLAAKEVSIFRSVSRAGDAYTVSYEKGNWYEVWKHSDSVMHFTAPGAVYCFSAIFAPARINTPIYHHWQYYDEAARKWRDAGRTVFPIVGGRDEGYRGYSTKTVTDGTWRCSVETERGSLLGRESVEVIVGEPPRPLVTESR